MTNKYFKKFGLSIFLIFPAILASAADGDGGGFWTFSNSIFILSALVVIVALVVILRLFNAMNEARELEILKEKGLDEVVKQRLAASQESWWSKTSEKWTAAVPLEEEEDIVFEHEYDGIRELDNSMPPWWLALFYFTIVIAAIYWVVYHVSDIGLSSEEQYNREIEIAKAEVDAYLATADVVDETSVELITDETRLAAGKETFIKLCAPCHLTDGGGSVGPNMTDEFWVHGCDIKDLFKTIKYGVPEKGMISWQSQLSATAMADVASYILTLQGTTPAVAKAAEGEACK